MDMEPPRRGGHEQHHLVAAPGKKRKKTDTTTANTDNGPCFCPIAAAAPLTTPPHPQASSAVRQALEQEVLSRADLLQSGAAVGDRRGERRMRNRASAERSRARRHAYMNELEAEVRLLSQENEQLKSLCEELKEAAEVPPAVKTTSSTTPRLQRTSSSPF